MSDHTFEIPNIIKGSSVYQQGKLYGIFVEYSPCEHRCNGCPGHLYIRRINGDISKLCIWSGGYILPYYTFAFNSNCDRQCVPPNIDFCKSCPYYKE